MGETETAHAPEQTGAFRPTFNQSIRVEARRERLTADAGVILMREILERTGLIDWLGAHFADPRRADQATYSMPELLRTQLLLLAQGWTNAADADHLRQDPALRLSVSDRKQDVPLRASSTPRTPDGLASQPTLSRLLAAASVPQNLHALEQASLHCLQQGCQWLDGRRRYRRLTVDVDSLPIEVHGQQAGSAYNGYYRKTCYHPLILGAAEHGYLFGAILRSGNVNTAEGVVTELRDYLDRLQNRLAWEITVRGDAGFPADELLSALEDRVPITRYVFRIRNYPPLQERARPFVQRYLEDLRERPDEVGAEPFRAHELTYQAKAWTQRRRVVLIIVPPEDGELLPRSFYLVTNYDKDTMSAASLLHLYRQRGTYEQQLGDFMHTLTPHLSSTTRAKRHYRGRDLPQRLSSRDPFDTNQALLSLNVLAHNLLNLGRRVAERAQAQAGARSAMSLNTFRQRYLKVPARLTLHGRRVWVSIADPAADLWSHWWDYMQRLGSPAMIN